MSQKLYLNILKFGIYFSLIAVFLVFKNLLFPFITSKQIFFNVLTEILFIFWIAFIIKYPSYRPKWNYITIGIAAFFAALLISCTTSIDFNLSFWGDIERMLGVFHLLHFFAYYLVIITVFRSRTDWHILLSASCFFAVFVALDSAFNEKTAYATIGNTAYVSAYMIFHIYFSLILFFQNKKLGPWRYLFLIGIPFYLLSMNRVRTSGAYVGLGFSVIMLFFFLGAFNRHKKIRLYAITVFLFLSLFVSYAFILNRDSRIVKSIPILDRLVREVNVDKNTFQTRLISWRAALKDFKEHPIVGTGHGNYAVIFDKYFDPKFYDQTRGETYFDRAHNNVFDIMSTSGILGILTYLSIFFAAAYYLIRGYFKGKFNIIDFSLISALITAYFVQNLAVFDSLVTYMGIMITLGFIYWLYERPEKDQEETADEPLVNKEIYALAAAGLVLLTIMYQYNIKVYKMLDATIAGQRAWASGDIVKTIDEYKRALSYNTPLDRDSRTSLNRLFVSNPTALNKIKDKAKAQEIIDYNIELAELNVDYNEKDSLNQMMLAQLLNIAAGMNKDNAEKFDYYSSRALEAINASIAASPGRVPVYFQKAQFLLTRGETDESLKTLEEAAALSDTYYDSFCHLGRTYLYYKQEDKGWENIDKCIDLGGAGILNDTNQIKIYINHYIEASDLERSAKLYLRLARLEKNNYENWVKLAKIYADIGEKEKALDAVDKAIEINPGIESYAQEFINGLE